MTNITVLLDEKPRLGSAISLTVKGRDLFGLVTSRLHDATRHWLVNITLDADSTWPREWFSSQRLLALYSCFREDVTPAEARALETAKITEENTLVSFLARHA